MCLAHPGALGPRPRGRARAVQLHRGIAGRAVVRGIHKSCGPALRALGGKILLPLRTGCLNPGKNRRTRFTRPQTARATGPAVPEPGRAPGLSRASGMHRKVIAALAERCMLLCTLSTAETTPRPHHPAWLEPGLHFTLNRLKRYNTEFPRLAVHKSLQYL